jgi:hypothetical protein
MDNLRSVYFRLRAGRKLILTISSTKWCLFYGSKRRQSLRSKHKSNDSAPAPIIPRLSNENFNLAEFGSHWSHDVLVVVTSIKLQGMWSPNIFSTRTGLFRVDCETKKWQSSMVAKFNWFGKPSQQRSQIFKFKVCLLIDALRNIIHLQLVFRRTGRRKACLGRNFLSFINLLSSQFRTPIL